MNQTMSNGTTVTIKNRALSPLYNGFQGEAGIIRSFDKSVGIYAVELTNCPHYGLVWLFPSEFNIGDQE